MTNLTVKLFNFVGSPVNLNLLFLILFAIMPVSYAVSVFIAVLIHEMAHAWAANKKGYRVYSIDIGLLNGSASMDSNMHQSDSIYITAAGPISNLILYILSISIGFIIPHQYIGHFALVNLLLFLFNILPIYPMDGGRIFRDYLMLKNKFFKISRYRALVISQWASLITSILLSVASLLLGYIFMSLFGIYFGYLALKDLKFIK